MSRVFVAEETALGRRVVVKVLAPRAGRGAQRRPLQARSASRVVVHGGRDISVTALFGVATYPDSLPRRPFPGRGPGVVPSQGRRQKSGSVRDPGAVQRTL